MYRSNSTRSAVLLGAQTPNGSYLEGVSKDLGNMSTYFRSPNGGAWNDNEVMPIYNPTWQEAIAKVQDSVADYSFTYFSGHGYRNANGILMLCFRNGDVPASYLFNNSPRQLIIVDACRKHEGSTFARSLSWPIEKWSYATGYSFARELFDQFIIDSPFGKLMIYSTEDNDYAYDNKEGRGGEFTLSLLDSVLYYQQAKQQGPLFIKDILNYSTVLLQQRQVIQTPCVVYERGFLKVPFGIISPTFIPVPKRRQQLVKADNNLTGVFIGAALLLTAYALYKSP